MEKESFELLGNMMVYLLNTDGLFTYDFLVAELHISRSSISWMKQGRDMYIHRYLKVINYILPMIQLTIVLPQLLKHIKIALTSHCDLVIGTIPPRRNGDCSPENWVVVVKWV